jgi:DNA mismatch endonuclease (patch repair protein)
MKKIGPKGSSQEKYIESIIRSLGYKHQLHIQSLPGKPDFVFPRKKKVVFVNGCFWHGHKNCKRTTLPSTNRKFWKDKIEGNVKRDRIVRRELNKQGWRTLAVWQCQMSRSKEQILTKRIKRFLEY